MVDLSNQTIKRIFEKQVSELTKRTSQAFSGEDLFDFQLSGGWLR